MRRTRVVGVLVAAVLAVHVSVRDSEAVVTEAVIAALYEAQGLTVVGGGYTVPVLVTAGAGTGAVGASTVTAAGFGTAAATTLAVLGAGAVVGSVGYLAYQSYKDFVAGKQYNGFPVKERPGLPGQFEYQTVASDTYTFSGNSYGYVKHPVPYGQDAYQAYLDFQIPPPSIGYGSNQYTSLTGTPQVRAFCKLKLDGNGYPGGPYHYFYNQPQGMAQPAPTPLTPAQVGTIIQSDLESGADPRISAFQQAIVSAISSALAAAGANQGVAVPPWTKEDLAAALQPFLDGLTQALKDLAIAQATAGGTVAGAVRVINPEDIAGPMVQAVEKFRLEQAPMPALTAEVRDSVRALPGQLAPAISSGVTQGIGTALETNRQAEIAEADGTAAPAPATFDSEVVAPTKKSMSGILSSAKQAALNLPFVSLISGISIQASGSPVVTGVVLGQTLHLDISPYETYFDFAGQMLLTLTWWFWGRQLLGVG